MEAVMPELLDCGQMELLCRQRAMADPNNSWKWLARAERWKNLGRHKPASSVRGSKLEQRDLGPMAMGPNTIAGDQRFGNLS